MGAAPDEAPPSRAYRPGGSPFRAKPRAPLCQRHVPVSAHGAGYRPQTAGRFPLAGLTVAALAIPSGMAYAAGLSPI